MAEKERKPDKSHLAGDPNRVAARFENYERQKNLLTIDRKGLDEQQAQQTPTNDGQQR